MPLSIWFWITLAISVLAAAPMFSLLNAIGVARGVVATGISTHDGRRNSVWFEETTLTLGDTVFLSIVNACVVEGFHRAGLPRNPAQWVWMIGGSVVIGAIVTHKWFTDAAKSYQTGKSWGWHWCGPTTDRISPAGYYHTVYFLVCAIFACVGVCLMVQPIGNDLKAGLVLGAVGYFLTLQHFLAVQDRLQLAYDRQHLAYDPDKRRQ